MVTAGCWQIPAPWLHQLVDGGILALPFRTNLDTVCVPFQREGERLAGLSASPASFIPLAGAFGRAPGVRLIADTDAWLMWDYEGERLEPAALLRLLQGEPGTRTLADLREAAGWTGRWDLGAFVALQGEPLVMLSPRDSQRWAETQWGLADTSRSSLCLVLPGGSEEPVCHVYGEDAAFRTLRGYVEAWRAAGKPAKSRLRLEAAPAEGAVLREMPQPDSAGRYRFRRGGLDFTAWWQTPN